MSVKKRYWLGAAALLYAAFVAWGLVPGSQEREAFESPADASRDAYGFRESRFGLLQKSSRRNGVAWPAGEAMAEPGRLGGTAGSFLLAWQGEKAPATMPDPEAWRDSLAEGEAVEFFAFATWVPGSGDAWEDPDWSVALTFRDPATGAPFSREELDAEGLPDSFHELRPSRTHETPMLRLVFRTEGMDHPHAPALVVGDSRTGAKVSYEFDGSVGGSPRRETSGVWLRTDASLLVWHDAPLVCRVQFLTGEPEHAQLERRAGTQTVFGEALRVQWLAAHERRPESVRVGGSLPTATGAGGPTGSRTKTASADPADDTAAEAAEAAAKAVEEFVRSRSTNRDPGFATFLFDASGARERWETVRCSSITMLERHTGVLVDGKVHRDWRKEETKGRLSLASRPVAEDADGPLPLVFIPGIVELDFAIAALPDMPNPRETANLFQATLPRITLPEDASDAESHLQGYIAVAAQLGWDSSRIWDDELPRGFPEDRTFRDTTPQDLLDWYLDHTPGSTARYDPDGLMLHFNEEKESRWHSILEGFLGWFDWL